MPARFPSERKLTYATGAISNGNYGTMGVVNLPRDLSAVNRRGYASTDSKGIPYTFKVAVHWIPSGLDGSGYVVSGSSDIRTTVKFLTVPNNWVAKNAGKVWHDARLTGMKRAGLKNKQLGAYAKEIRYNWDESDSSSSFLAPVDGAGAALAGGTWDTTTIFTPLDEDGFSLKLLGTGHDEDNTQTGTVINALHSYLQSRGTVELDSNLDIETVPSDRSLLLSLQMGSDSDEDERAALIANVKDSQDAPPYDPFDGADTNNDITESVESARIIMYPSQNAGIVTTTFEAPYGLFEVLAANRDPGDNSGVVDDMAFTVEVLDIYPMQG
jgi:hypothetical protein